MAVSKSAAKRHRQSLRRRMRNRSAKSQIRNTIKSFLGFVEGGDRAMAETTFNDVKKLLDNAQGRGILHRNTVARRKSRLARQLNNME